MVQTAHHFFITICVASGSGEMEVKMKKYVCEVCGYIYDPEVGDADGGIDPGIDFDDLPDYWVCPICSFNKDNFSVEI